MYTICTNDDLLIAIIYGVYICKAHCIRICLRLYPISLIYVRACTSTQILINRYVYESATGNTIVRKRDKILLTIAIGVGVQLLIPMILTIVLDILNGEGKKIGSDIKYILTKPKNWLHLIPQTAYSLLFV